MQAPLTEPKPVVSPLVYARVLSAKRLARRLLPEGIYSSPYEVLDYDATLTLHDAQGMQATFQRKQRVRFLQDGVSAILDHAWGDGVLLTHYDHSAGRLAGSYKDQGRRHLVIQLERPMRRGETLEFMVRRTGAANFTNGEEWLETTIDHPVCHLTRRVVFPKDRPCKHATLYAEGRTVLLPVESLPDGTTQVIFETTRPMAHEPYLLRWSW